MPNNNTKKNNKANKVNNTKKNNANKVNNTKKNNANKVNNTKKNNNANKTNNNTKKNNANKGNKKNNANKGNKANNNTKNNNANKGNNANNKTKKNNANVPKANNANLNKAAKQLNKVVPAIKKGLNSLSNNDPDKAVWKATANFLSEHNQLIRNRKNSNSSLKYVNKVTTFVNARKNLTGNAAPANNKPANNNTKKNNAAPAPAARKRWRSWW